MEGLTEGRIVHFVMRRGTNQGAHRPAIVVHVWRDGAGNPPANGVCQLQVFPDGLNDGFLEGHLWETSVVYDGETMAPGTWHWIEKA